MSRKKKKKFDLETVVANFERAKTYIPMFLAGDTELYFVKSWETSSFNGQPWEEVQRRIPGTAAYKYPKDTGLGRRTRAILVKSGALRAAVNNSVREREIERIRFVVSLPYARYHNYGTAKMPARPFMKHTPELQRIHIARITKLLKDCWNF